MTVAVDPTGAAFGVWQAARGGVGAEAVAEPGALVRTDAHLPDPDRGRAFYAGVFGYEYQPVPGAPGTTRPSAWVLTGSVGWAA